LLLFGGLPQLDAIAFRIHHPAESAVLRFLDLIDRDALGLERGEDRVEILDLVIDHERLRARVEVAGISIEDGPDRGAAFRGIVVSSPLKLQAAPRLDRESQVLLVPASKHFRVLCLEKYSANSRHAAHLSSNRLFGSRKRGSGWESYRNSTRNRRRAAARDYLPTKSTSSGDRGNPVPTSPCEAFHQLSSLSAAAFRRTSSACAE